MILNTALNRLAEADRLTEEARVLAAECRDAEAKVKYLEAAEIYGVAGFSSSAATNRLLAAFCEMLEGRA